MCCESLGGRGGVDVDPPLGRPRQPSWWLSRGVYKGEADVDVSTAAVVLLLVVSVVPIRVVGRAGLRFVRSLAGI